MVELILTGATIACVIGLQLFASAQKRDPETIWELVAIALGITLLIWTPAWVRSTLVGAFAVLAVWELGIWFAAAMLALVVAIAIWLPGGVSVVMCAILVGAGIRQLRDARRHMVRLSRAAQLVVDQSVDHEVELTGAAHAVRPTVDPVFGGPCALWRVDGEGTRQSDVMIEIRGPNGSALVDPTSVWLELERPAKTVSGEEAKRAAELLRVDLLDGKLHLLVVPEGTECYVIGTPTWESAPASVGLYRDQHRLPTFRSTPESRALFADRSEAQLRGDYLWAMVSWSTWGALCGALAVLQLGGWA